MPFQAQWCQIVTLQSIQGHTGLTHPFNFLTFRHFGTQDWVSDCPSVKKLKWADQTSMMLNALILIFATIRKSVGLKGLNKNCSLIWKSWL